ncbi:CRISPR system precrRNA processing endoribonuclease RAMP protein Cas6 [Aquifex aeolicus]|uniref:CRISPR system precrRNA processing endoribonuclease RAMP protein Cas6 n=1 Tax=Aquifex aeolicus TaxID=63363 RepID=UPI0002E9E6BC|nr:CRISPR system precrRNA processing endoribonuclease RAMP protein Cas6 [Aquifex aeolicus]
MRFSDFPLDADLREFIEKNIFVSGVWTKTRKVETGQNAKLVGFTGRVVYYVWINALSSFSEFAGVGRKTTMGFGKTRKVPLKNLE